MHTKCFDAVKYISTVLVRKLSQVLRKVLTASDTKGTSADRCSKRSSTLSIVYNHKYLSSAESCLYKRLF